MKEDLITWRPFAVAIAACVGFVVGIAAVAVVIMWGWVAMGDLIRLHGPIVVLLALQVAVVALMFYKAYRWYRKP